MAARKTPRPNDVDSYLRSLEPDRRREFETLREWVRKVLPSARETFAYRMPTYESRQAICAIAAQKRHFALYVCLDGVLDRHRDAFAQLDVGKGCIRFQALADLPRSAARLVLRDAARQADELSDPRPQSNMGPRARPEDPS